MIVNVLASAGTVLAIGVLILMAASAELPDVCEVFSRRH